MNEYKVKVVIDGLDEAEAKAEKILQRFAEIKQEIADMERQLSALELTIKVPEADEDDIPISWKEKKRREENSSKRKSSTESSLCDRLTSVRNIQNSIFKFSPKNNSYNTQKGK